MSRLLILDVVVDVVMRMSIMFALFLLFSGHNAPGGGFIGGLVAGISFILGYIARGEEEIAAIMRARPDELLGVGLVLAVLTGVAGWAWGSGFLDSVILAVEAPGLGTVKASSALVFDIGVFGIVVGLVASLIAVLGDEADIR